MVRNLNNPFLFKELAQMVKPRTVETFFEKITLRPYQQESVDAVFDAWESNNSTLVCLPTGCGKSVVFSGVMKRYSEIEGSKRMIVVAHRSELVYQARQHAINAGLTVGVEKAFEQVGKEQVMATSVQTQMSSRKCPDCNGAGCDFCDSIGKVAQADKVPS